MDLVAPTVRTKSMNIPATILSVNSVALHPTVQDAVIAQLGSTDMVVDKINVSGVDQPALGLAVHIASIRFTKNNLLPEFDDSIRGSNCCRANF